MPLPEKFRPMLAAPATDEEIRDLIKRKRELWAFPKIDGVRAVLDDSRVYTRSLKPLPNVSTATLMPIDYQWTDGEMTVGPATASDCCRATTSALNTISGQPEWTYHVFDCIEPWMISQPYEVRYARAAARGATLNHVIIKSYIDLRSLEDVWVSEMGYEGLILRDPNAPYKFGRSTLREGGMVKRKLFQDSEAEIVDMVELQRNRNAAITNELGLTSRSSHKANQVAGGVMGTLVCRDLTTGIEFEIGTGFTAKDREDFWADREQIIRSRAVVKYKFFPVGQKEKPRHPGYLGLRPGWDR